MPKTLLIEERSKYQAPEFKKRRAVLKDTVEKFTIPGAADRYREQARKNHQQWDSARISPPNHVRVLAGDWGDVTHDLAKTNGAIYAVLNMANAYSPGGGYLEGMVAQEENMYRRTDCHFYVHDDEMDEGKNLYTSKMTQLINGVHGRVYLDTTNPRICIKGREEAKASGYTDLDPEDYFLFYELKSAADDLRGGDSFDEASMRKKIAAQLDTLKEKNIRHVVLSAFGCGAFGNPPAHVARIYREELTKRIGDFDDVVFAVYHANYGSNNFIPFQKELDGLPLNQKQLDIDKKLTSTLKDNLNQKIWDKRGFAFIFLTVEKHPQVLCKSELSSIVKWTNLANSLS